MSEGEATRGDFKILIAPCNITGKYDKVISYHAGTVEIDPGEGEEKKNLEIWVQYSDEGLDVLKRALNAAPLPLELPEPPGIRANTRYQWDAHLNDGTILYQYPGDHNLGHFDPHQCRLFHLRPKEWTSDLPHFYLDRERGWMWAKNSHTPVKALTDSFGRSLPIPTVPFHLEYHRRIAITFAAGASGSDVLPPHVRHELGWRVDTLHGYPEETWFQIAIEDDDGSWQICREEPEGSPFLAREGDTLGEEGDGSNPVLPEGPDGGPKLIEGAIRIVDPFLAAV